MSADLGILLLRLTVGLLLAGHGAQKLFGWFGGFGLAGTAGFFGGQLRLRPARFWTLLAGLSELGGGLLLALGLLTSLGSAAIAAAMLMAIIVAHWPRFWAMDNGIEYPLVLLAAAVGLGLIGPGAYSLDAALSTTLPHPAALLVSPVLALIGVVVALATRAPVPAVESEDADGRLVAAH
jgi:putative oxidoreductase